MQTFSFSSVETLGPINSASATGAPQSTSVSGDGDSFASQLAKQTAKTAETQKVDSQTSKTANTSSKGNQATDASSTQELSAITQQQNKTTDPATEEYSIQGSQLITAQVVAQITGNQQNSTQIQTLLDSVISPKSSTQEIQNSLATSSNQGNAYTTASGVSLLTTQMAEELTQLAQTSAATSQPVLTTEAPSAQQVNTVLAGTASLTATTQAVDGDDLNGQIKVEGWSASFSNGYTAAQEALSAGKSQAPLAGQVSTSPQVETQTESGQVITVYQSSTIEEVAAKTVSGNTSLTTDPSGQRQDNTSNYIHSNLPNNSSKTVLSQQEQQLGDENTQENTGEKSLASQTVNKSEPIVTSESTFTPVSFESLNSSTTTTTQSTTSTTTMLRLPSGTTVPESAVMDQVVNYFNANRKLESGSVTLTLHPRELGELHMEIKVEQDNIRAHITTQSPQAQEALDKHLPRLREALEQQGLILNDVEISIASNEEYDGNHFQQNEERHNLSQSFRSTGSQEVFSLGDEEEDEEFAEAQQNLHVTA